MVFGLLLFFFSLPIPQTITTTNCVVDVKEHKFKTDSKAYYSKLSLISLKINPKLIPERIFYIMVKYGDYLNAYPKNGEIWCGG